MCRKKFRVRVRVFYSAITRNMQTQFDCSSSVETIQDTVVNVHASLLWKRTSQQGVCYESVETNTVGILAS